MFAWMKALLPVSRSTHEDGMAQKDFIIAELDQTIGDLKKRIKELGAENAGYQAASRLNRQLRLDAEHTAKVLTEQLQAKTDQAGHYRDILTEIRGMTTPGANATVKRMAARAEYALQTYACVAEGVA